jgi:hypothetical protein
MDELLGNSELSGIDKVKTDWNINGKTNDYGFWQIN